MTASRPRSSLGQIVRARRLTLGMSQEALAIRVTDLGSEITQADVSRIELGKVELPRRRRLEHLADALELSLGELLEASGWVGAVGRFIDGDTTPEPSSRASSAPAQPSPIAGPAPFPPPFGRSVPAALDPMTTMDAIVRLRTAIVQAQEPVARAARLLHDCQMTAQRWDAGLRQYDVAVTERESRRLSRP